PCLASGRRGGHPARPCLGLGGRGKGRAGRFHLDDHGRAYHGSAIQWLRSAMITRMITTAASNQAPLRCSLVESTATATSRQMPKSVYDIPISEREIPTGPSSSAK